MSEEILVSAILQASLTGAGLIFAVFALLLPLGSELITYRKKTFQEITKEMIEKLKKAEKGPKHIDLEDTQKALYKLYDFQDALAFSKWAVIVPFMLYLVSAISSVLWLDEYPLFDMQKMYSLILWTFLIACILFAYIGYTSLSQVLNLFEKKYVEDK